METDFDPYQHLTFLANRVARLLSREVKSAVQRELSGLPPSCIGILADLWSRDGVTQTELGTSLIKNKSSVNKMLTTLEQHNLISKMTDSSDARNKRIFLTERGKRVQAIVEGADLAVEQRLLRGVEAADIATTKRVLTVLYQNLSSATQDKTIL